MVHNLVISLTNVHNWKYKQSIAGAQRLAKYQLNIEFGLKKKSWICHLAKKTKLNCDVEIVALETSCFEPMEVIVQGVH